LALAFAIVLAGFSLYSHINNNDIIQSAVKVTNLEGNSGGSGVVLSSNSTESLVLTNAHVCGVVVDGGTVSGHNAIGMVKSYKVSQYHDLCLITVSGNLRASTRIADRGPAPYYEEAQISGHPHLYPNVVTKGHFSDTQVITVLMDIRDCTAEDMKDPESGFMCLMFGGIPVVRTFQAMLVTAAIMPGSSGSGVYNSNKDLTGLAFAGSGDLSYAWTVPYAYLKYFLTTEISLLEAKLPNLSNEVANKEKQSSRAERIRKFRSNCTASIPICTTTATDLIWSTDVAKD
jgi:hypothetical protein